MIDLKRLLVGLGGLAFACLPLSAAQADDSAAAKVGVPPAGSATTAVTTDNTKTNTPDVTITPPVTITPAKISAPDTTNASATPSTSATTNTPSSNTAAVTNPTDAPGEKMERLLYKPGQTISAGMQAEDIVVTDDIELAKEQVAHFPDSPEASFILACALTRTSMVEEALKEVRRARRLAEAKGGPQYFDKMIHAYEDMLTLYPDDNRIRYGLAWAYYMKAYVLEKYSKPANPTVSVTVPNTPNAVPNAVASKPANWQEQWVSAIASATTGVKNVQGNPDNTLPHIPDVMSKAPPEMRPQLKLYFEAALMNLDELLQRNPNDVWSLVYRAFLRAEYTGNLGDSMKVWRACRDKYPDNPAPYFFLGEGYLKEGNLKESLQNISRAIALRALGK